MGGDLGPDYSILIDVPGDSACAAASPALDSLTRTQFFNAAGNPLGPTGSLRNWQQVCQLNLAETGLVFCAGPGLDFSVLQKMQGLKDVAPGSRTDAAQDMVWVRVGSEASSLISRRRNRNRFWDAAQSGQMTSRVMSSGDDGIADHYSAYARQ